jgi:hypothetical protein
MKRDDSVLCDHCYLRRPHWHYYIVRSERTTHGFEVQKVKTFHIPDDKGAVEDSPGFLGWVDDAQLLQLEKYYNNKEIYGG